MARIFSILVIFLMGCESLHQKDKKTAQAELQLGTSELQTGAYPQALNTLLKAEQLDPENPVIQNNLGLAYFVRDHFKEAEEHIKTAIQIEPKYSDAYNNLGRTYIEMGRYQEAIENLQVAINDLTYTSPDKALLNLGLVYFKMKKYETAKNYIVRALEIQRDNCIAQSLLGRCFFEQKKYSQAAVQLDKASGFCQRSLFDEPVYYSALSYYQDGHKNLATNRLESLLKLYANGKYRDRAKAMLEIMRK